MKKIPEKLSDTLISRIQKYIKENTELSSKTPIGIGVFDLLRKRSKLVFYPLENEENDAFLLEGMPSGDGKVNFVFINTAKTIEKQVFAAAHELGHLLDVPGAIRMGHRTEDLDERIVNRFAAELLMPEHDFKDAFLRESMGKVNDNTITFRDFAAILVHMMDRYSVPYDAALLRSREVGLISEDAARDSFEGNSNLTRDAIDAYISKLISSGSYNNLQTKTYRKDIDGLEALLQKAETVESIPAGMINRLRKRYDVPSDTVRDNIISKTLVIKQGD